MYRTGSQFSMRDMSAFSGRCSGEGASSAAPGYLRKMTRCDSRKVSRSDLEECDQSTIAIFSSYLKKVVWHLRYAVSALNRL
jgi:hypothetical protein